MSKKNHIATGYLCAPILILGLIMTFGAVLHKY